MYVIKQSNTNLWRGFIRCIVGFISNRLKAKAMNTIE